MINLDRFFHVNSDGKKFVYNSDLLKLNIDNKEYNSIKRLLKKNNIEVITVVKDRKVINHLINTQTENEELFDRLRKYKTVKNSSFRSKLIEGNIHIVNYLIFKNYILYEIDYDEYASYAFEELIDSVDSFISSNENNFYDYASRKINNRILKELSNETGLKNATYSKFLIIKKELETDFGRKLSSDNYDTYKQILDIMLRRSYISQKEYNNIIKNEINSNQDNEDNIFLMEEEVKKIDSILSNIKVKYENIIRLNFGIGEKKYTLDKIANKLGCTKANVGQQLNNGLEELREYIFNTYSKDEALGLYILVRKSCYDVKECIMDVPYTEENIEKLFNDYIRFNKINRYDLRLFDINKNYVINEALTGNDKAMFLALRSDIILKEHTRWISISTAKKYYFPKYLVNGHEMFNFVIREKEENICNEMINNIFKSLIYRKLNSKEQKWIKDNKTLLMKNATSGDIKAMYICLRTVDNETSTLYISPTEAINFYSYNSTIDGVKLYDGLKVGMSIAFVINSLFDFYKQNNHLPSKEEQENEFGINLEDYINSNKEYIISLAQKGNDKAMFICLRLKDKNKPWITREQAQRLFPEKYEVEEINMYKNDISEQSLNKTIKIIFNILKSYGGLTRKSNVLLKNKHKINIEEWIENNKDVLLKKLNCNAARVAYILLHVNSSINISLKDLLKIYPINYLIDDVMLYSNIECYGKDSISLLYDYHREYKTFVQDTLTVNKLGIDTRKIFIQNKEIIYDEVKKNNYKAKYVYAEALKDFDNKVVTSNEDLKDIKEIINQVYDDYMINGIKPDKSNYSLWLLKHQKELINEAKNKNMKANEILNSYKENYIEISSINSQALLLCLNNNWILRRDARCLSSYYRLKKYEKKLIKK